MRLSIHHRTSYRYETPATYAAQLLRLFPSDSAAQKVIDWQISADAATLSPVRLDGFGNRTQLLTVDQPHSHLSIDVSGLIESSEAPDLVLASPPGERVELFCRPTALTKPFAILAEEMQPFQKPSFSLSTAEDLMHWVRDKIDYTTGVTHVATSAESAYQEGQGVCQDHAHVYITAARLLGQPARYVSGYLWASDDPGEVFEAAHAWAEVYIQDQGWIAFDVANRCRPDGRYVRLAHGRDYQDAAPVRGTRRGGAEETLAVEVRVAAGAQQQ